MKKGKYLFIFIFFTFIVFPISSIALQFNPIITEKTYEVNTNSDGYTELVNQDLTIAPVKVNNEFANYSGSELIEGDKNHTQLERWHSENDPYHYLSEALTTPTKGSKSKVEYNPQNDVTPILYEETVNNSYESLKFIHYSATGYKGEFKPTTAWYEFPEEMTIGEVSFFVMVHTNVTLQTGKPEARFEFNLDNIGGNNEMVKGYFEIVGKSKSVFYLSANIYPNGNRTGLLASEPIQVYNGSDNFFNWVKVNIFFDTWNDFYNISFQQYGSDWKVLDNKPVSYLVMGDQHNEDNSARLRSGNRLAASHLLNKLQFKLFSDAKQSTSYAYIDNVTYRYYEFPAVYADIIYDNATYRQNPEPKRWLNRSIIMSYGPPKYPNMTSTNLAFDTAYFLNKEDMNYLHVWENAPTWMYSIPLVIPSDNSDIAVRTILNLLNDTENPLEERGLIKPGVSTLYHQKQLGPFSSMDWEFDKENSTDFIFYFNSKNTDYKIKIAYTSDSKLGIFNQFKLYEGQDDRAPGLIDFWVETILLVPGYSPLLIISIVGVVSIVISLQNKRKLKIND